MVLLTYLWNFSRAKIDTTSCDISNEWAAYLACAGAKGTLIKFDRKVKFKAYFSHSLFEQGSFAYQ